MGPMSVRPDVSRRVPFHVRLRVPVGEVAERRGWLIEGPAGWGECSPLPSWSPAEHRAAERSALEAAREDFPRPVRSRVEVNALVPRVPPPVGARMAVASGCRTIKVKVGDADAVERVRAIREALGPAGRIRLDANGAWDLDEAGRELARLAPFDVELVEDPVPGLEDMAMLRRTSPIPVAAEMSVRTPKDARRLRRLSAADALVIKPQRIGGVRTALAAAEEAGVPCIPSSALETSVGLASVLAVAAALPELPFAAGAGTGLLLETDVAVDPLVPVDGWLEPRRPSVLPAVAGEVP
jgi:o-succinylbenzoate synthase